MKHHYTFCMRVRVRLTFWSRCSSSAKSTYLFRSTYPIDKAPSVVIAGIIMTFPPNADENAPVAWPEPHSPVVERENLLARPQPGADVDRQNTTASSLKKSGERRMGWRDFINISISMAGAQIAWTLELGYGISTASFNLLSHR